MLSNIKTRFAPTPSGFLHLGNVLSFAITWGLARKYNGTIVLRIDDLDNYRFRPEYLDDIFDTLSFLGLDYDEGPRDQKEFFSHYSQKFRTDHYISILKTLLSKELLYACTCSRKHTPYTYDRSCLHRSHDLFGANCAWRVKVPPNKLVQVDDLAKGRIQLDLDKEMADFVVKRKEGLPAYQIASLSDDIVMGVNVIVRGQDLLPSTAAQLYLSDCIGNLSFPKTTFLHHLVIKDDTGKKLSKSEGSHSIFQMRKNGTSSKKIWEMISFMLHWEEPVYDSKGFLLRFEPLQLPNE